MTATDEKILLEAVLLDPFDDAPRLIYADWLEENGQPERAEFVRLQIETGDVLSCLGDSSVGQACPDYYHKETYGDYCPNCLAASHNGNDFLLGESADGYKLSRGFISEIRLTCSDFMRYAGDIFAAQPVVKVVLTDKEPYKSRTWYLFYSSPQSSLYNSINHYLPNEIFSRASEKVYDTEAHILDDLSRACVAYARELAGLPPIDWSRER